MVSQTDGVTYTETKTETAMPDQHYPCSPHWNQGVDSRNYPHDPDTETNFLVQNPFFLPLYFPLHWPRLYVCRHEAASSDYLIRSLFFSSHKFLLLSICFFKAADCSQGELGGAFWPAKTTSHHPDVCQGTALDTCSRLSVGVRYGLLGGRPGHVYLGIHLTISLNTLLPRTGN